MSKTQNLLWSAFAYLAAINGSLFLNRLGLRPIVKMSFLLLVYLLATGIVIGLYRKDKSKRIAKYGNEKLVLIGLGGIAFSFLLQLLVGKLQFLLLGKVVVSENTDQILTLFQHVPFYFLIPLLLTPIMEEIVFRYFIPTVLSEKWSPLVSVMLASFLFSALHGDGQWLIYFSLGLFYGYLQNKTASVIPSMIAHIGMNGFILLMFG